MLQDLLSNSKSDQRANEEIDSLAHAERQVGATVRSATVGRSWSLVLGPWLSCGYPQRRIDEILGLTAVVSIPGVAE